MLKPHKLCNVCKQIESNPKLLKDIYNSTAFLKTSNISLRTIWDEYKQVYGEQFTYDALRNHVKKHQFVSEKDYNNRHLRQLASQAEKQVLKRQLEATDVWNQVIEKGSEALSNGEMTIKAADLLKAAKDKSDHALRTQDQEIAVAMMVAHFASGENKPKGVLSDRRVIEGEAVQDFDPSVGTTADYREGEDGSSPVYYPPSWDAAT